MGNWQSHCRTRQVILIRPLCLITTEGVFIFLIRLRSNKYKPKNVYTDNDFLELYKAAKGTEHELPVLSAGACGLRRSEVFGLSWDNIDTDNMTIAIKQAAVPIKGDVTLKSTKNYTSERTFTYPAFMNELLKRKRNRFNICNSGR